MMSKIVVLAAGATAFVATKPVATLAPMKSITSLEDVGVVEAFPGFFDPLALSEGKSEVRVKFLREAELKHGRVAMLAATGFLVAEKFHPLFGASIDSPSYMAFQQTPLQTFWPIVVGGIALIEAASALTTFENPLQGAGWWSLKADHAPGDLGFDPLGLKPAGADLKEMQTKELQNGRLAMLGIAGMVAQELVSGAKIF